MEDESPQIPSIEYQKSGWRPFFLILIAIVLGAACQVIRNLILMNCDCTAHFYSIPIMQYLHARQLMWIFHTSNVIPYVELTIACLVLEKLIRMMRIKPLLLYPLISLITFLGLRSIESFNYAGIVKSLEMFIGIIPESECLIFTMFSLFSFLSILVIAAFIHRLLNEGRGKMSLIVIGFIIFTATVAALICRSLEFNFNSFSPICFQLISFIIIFALTLFYSRMTHVASHRQ